MNETRFILALSRTTKAYNWSVDRKNNIVGVARNGDDRGRAFSPLTALCRFTRNGTYRDTKRGLLKQRKLPSASRQNEAGTWRERLNCSF